MSARRRHIPVVDLTDLDDSLDASLYDLTGDDDDDDGAPSQPPFVSSSDEENHAVGAASRKGDDLDDDDDVLEEDRKPAARVIRNKKQDAVPLLGDSDEEDNASLLDDDDFVLLEHSNQWLNRRRKEEEDDLKLAHALQKEEEQRAKSHESAQKEAEASMLTSTTGKAWKFVEQVLDLHKKLSVTTAAATTPRGKDGAVTEIGPVAVDDMVFTTERVLQAQEEFRAAKRPVTVDIGYHYTRSKNLSSIQQDGLMSRPERDASKVESKFNGSAYGEGACVFV